MPGYTKKRIVSLMVLTVILALVANVLFGRWLAVKLSMLPVLNRYKIISPQTPVVINNQQTIRVSDSGDSQQALALARPKLSLVLSSSGGQVTVLGTAINLTADGLFVAVKPAPPTPTEALTIKLDDGTLAPVIAEASDSGSNLVILKTAQQNDPTADLASSKNASVGQKLIFIAPGVPAFSAGFAAGFISQAQGDNVDAKNSDQPSRGFKISESDELMPGQAVADSSGNILGLWDGSRLISSDVIKQLSDNYISNGRQITRPQFGFAYRTLSQPESQLLGQPVGAKVTSVVTGLPAQKAGLLAGDIIQDWDQTTINDANVLEEVLAGVKPGDQASVKISRGKNQITLNLTAGQLK